MLQHCYYYNKITGLSRRITIHEMLRRSDINNEGFRSMKNSLYRTEDHRIPMALVKKGAHKGFRRKGSITERICNYCWKRTDYKKLQRQRF